MNKILISLLVLGLLACNRIPQEDLTDYSTHSAERDINNALKENNVTFLFVCGFACYPPGIGFLERTLCFKNINSRTIGPIGDYGVDIRLQMHAKEYAEQYNNLLLAHLKPDSSCLPTEQWDEAANKFFEYLRNKVDPHVSTGYSSPVTLKNLIISIDIRKPNNAEEIVNEACSIFKANGIYRDFGVKINHKDNYRCVNGEYEKL